jgi:hypothetical protein
VLAQIIRDLGQHLLLVLDPLRGDVGTRGAGRLGRQVLLDVAVDQVLDGRSLAPLALRPGRVLPPVDLPAQLLGPLARGLDRPSGIAADGVAPLTAVDSVVDKERRRPAGIDADPEALGPRIIVPLRQRAALFGRVH